MEVNAHQPNDLKQMQSLPLEAKIRMTQARIRVWYEAWQRFEIYDQETGKTRFVTMDARDQFAEPQTKATERITSVMPGQVYVSFSGGKDSTVLKHIVDNMYDDVPSLFVNTGLEYPEIQRFARSQPNVVTVWPDMRFDEVIKKYGYPAISKDVSECVYWGKRGSSTRLKRLNGELLMKNGEPSMFNCARWKFMLEAPFEISAACCKIMKKTRRKNTKKRQVESRSWDCLLRKASKEKAHGGKPAVMRSTKGDHRASRWRSGRSRTCSTISKNTMCHTALSTVTS